VQRNHAIILEQKEIKQTAGRRPPRRPAVCFGNGIIMYAGLDIGTSGVKAAVYDAAGQELAFYSKSFQLLTKEDGTKELNPNEVLGSAIECLLYIGSKAAIETVTVLSLGEAIVFLDGNEECISNIVVGTDARGQDQLQWLMGKIEKEKLIKITGLNLSTIYSVNKILWFRDNQPQIYNKASRICTVQDYIIGKLSGNYIIDYSMASRTMLFDVTNNAWSEELLSITGIDKKLLSVPVLAGTPAGYIKPVIAEKLSAPASINVLAGTHDHICNALGAGVIDQGWCSDTAGTTEGLTALIGSVKVNDSHVSMIDKNQLSFEPFVISNTFNTVAWHNTAGALYRWFVENIGVPGGDSAVNPYQIIEEKMSPMPSSLLVLPHFSGAATPYMDAQSRGAIIGLSVATRGEHIFQALVESTNHELLMILDCLAKSDIVVRNIVATGAALSHRVLKIKANVLGLPIKTVCCKQTGTLGGAIIGAVFSKAYHTYGEAISNMVKFGKEYMPEPDTHALYMEKHTMYTRLYRQLKELNHELFMYNSRNASLRNISQSPWAIS
jgi:xylulokinase